MEKCVFVFKLLFEHTHTQLYRTAQRYNKQCVQLAVWRLILFVWSIWYSYYFMLFVKGIRYDRINISWRNWTFPFCLFSHVFRLCTKYREELKVHTAANTPTQHRKLTIYVQAGGLYSVFFLSARRVVSSQNVTVRDYAVSSLLLLLSEVTRIIPFTKGKIKNS